MDAVFTFCFMLVTFTNSLSLQPEISSLQPETTVNRSLVNVDTEWFGWKCVCYDPGCWFVNDEGLKNNEVKLKLYSNSNPNGINLYWNGNTIGFDWGINPNIAKAKTVFFSHGFIDDATMCKDQIVPNFFELNDQWQVVCIDWNEHAEIDYAGGIYNNQPVMAVDIGYFLGRFLKQFSNAYEIDGGMIRLVGHSLGAHLVGAMAREFSSNGQKIKRVTGLDPAGPQFASDMWCLFDFQIKSSDADFVDIIHTNSAMYGFKMAHGHADFYPDGGRWQSSCDWENSCSHGRAIKYYRDSITNSDAFEAGICNDVSACENEQIHETSTQHMGFHATKPNKNTLYYLKIYDSGTDNKGIEHYRL